MPQENPLNPVSNTIVYLLQYKFDDYHLDYQLLRKTIEYCFDNFLQADREFDSYRSFAALQKEEFIKDTKEVFAKLLAN